MRIVFADNNPAMVDAWKALSHPEALKGIELFRGSILDAGCEAVVSPANSFGFMDGGIDLVYTQAFGRIVQERLQADIAATYDGELLVGQAHVVATDGEPIRYVVAAPTMRVPQVLSRKTVNPYLATRAALRQAQRAGFIASLAVPGMGTGSGMVNLEVAALQMALAVRDWCTPPVFPTTWQVARMRHDLMA